MKELIFGKNIHLHLTTSGHYAILLNINLNLKMPSLEDSKFAEVPLTIDNIYRRNIKQGKKIYCKKLHKQLEHS